MSLHTPLFERSRTLDQSDIHDILRNDRRRRIIEQLRDAGETLTVRELSERIATEETGESPAPRDARKSVYVSLHQTHLPKLDDWGIIDYDYRSKELTLLDGAKEVEVYMEVVPEGDISWGMYYLGLGVVALVTLLATRFDLLVVSGLNFRFWAWFYAILLTLSALYHTWHSLDANVAW